MKKILDLNENYVYQTWLRAYKAAGRALTREKIRKEFGVDVSVDTVRHLLEMGDSAHLDAHEVAAAIEKSIAEDA